MAALHCLGFLNLSYNEFSRRILTSTQIQSFDSDKFIGNLGLCGPPLIGKCPKDVTSNPTSSKNYHDGDEFWKCLYIGTGLGFIVGFWGVCGSLMLNRSWRHAYFLLMINLKDWLYHVCDNSSAYYKIADRCFTTRGYHNFTKGLWNFFGFVICF